MSKLRVKKSNYIVIDCAIQHKWSPRQLYKRFIRKFPWSYFRSNEHYHVEIRHEYQYRRKRNRSKHHVDFPLTVVVASRRLGACSWVCVWSVNSSSIDIYVVYFDMTCWMDNITCVVFGTRIGTRLYIAYVVGWTIINIENVYKFVFILFIHLFKR